MSRNRVVVGVAIAVVAIVAATIWALADSNSGDASLAGTSWTLSDLDSAEVTGTAPTLAFTEGEVNGTGGCNSFGGPYTTGGDAISFGPIASTLMACEGPILEQETVYFAALEGANRYTVEGDALTLTGDAGTLTFSAT